MSDFPSAGKLVVCLLAGNTYYYQLSSGQWTSKLKPAQEFATAADAQQETNRIGSGVFLDETCDLQAVYVITYPSCSSSDP